VLWPTLLHDDISCSLLCTSPSEQPATCSLLVLGHNKQAMRNPGCWDVNPCWRWRGKIWYASRPQKYSRAISVPAAAASVCWTWGPAHTAGRRLTRRQSHLWECQAAGAVQPPAAVGQHVAGVLPPLLGAGAVLAAAVGLQTHHVVAVVHSSGPVQSYVSSSSMMPYTLLKTECGMPTKKHI